MGIIGKAFKAVVGVVKKVIGVVAKVTGGIFGFLVGGKKTGSAAAVNNLNKSLEPETARKIVFGKIAAPLDVRFWEVYGSGAKFFDEVLALATHTITSVQELYLEDKLAISAAGVVQAPYNNSVLTRTVKLGLPGQTALTAGGGSLWTSASKFTGCAHMVLKWNCDEKKLPGGVPSRYTQVVEGAPVYDPRRDSTRGGSGTHRIDDQTTWAYSTLDANGQPIGRNNALQALWYIIGWRNENPSTAEKVLVAGRGVDYEDINLATFIAGANACEVAGYYTDCLLSTDDDHTNNEDKITCDGLIGRLIDPGGLWSYYANVDDTANIAVELTDADILDTGSVTWNEYKGMGDQFNQVGGKYINPSSITLFQPFPYPTVRDATYEANLGKKVRKTLDFQQILDSTVAQRLARLYLNQGQYQGEFQADFMPRAMKAQAWSIVRYTSERFGWTKLFRVWRHEINNGKVTMLLKEVHSSIWGAGTIGTPLTPVAGVNYDLLTAVPLTGMVAQALTITGAGAYPIIQDGVTITWTAPPDNVRHTEVRYRLVGSTYWQNAAPVMRGAATGINIFPLVKGSAYEIAARHISINDIEGAYTTVSSFTVGIAGNIVTANAAVLGSIDPLTGRIVNPQMYNTQMLLNVRNTTNIVPTYTVGASNVTVNIPAHTRVIAGLSGPITLNYAAGSFVVAFSTGFIVYVDDPELDGEASATYVAITNADNLLYPGRYFVTSGVSPASNGTGGTFGGGGTSGGGSGGYGGGGGGGGIIEQ